MDGADRDTLHGWLLVEQLTMEGPRPLAFYQTVDGGKAWTLIATKPVWTADDCIARGMPTFSSPTTGWIWAGCSGTHRANLTMMVTRDAGLTWSVVVLVTKYCDLTIFSDGCEPRVVSQFFDQNHGIYVDINDSLLFATSDGGQSWRSNPLPRGRTYSCPGKYGPTTCDSVLVSSATFISPGEGWLSAIDYDGHSSTLDLIIEHTTNGGSSWAVVYRKRQSIQADQGSFFQFVDSNSGFWWFGNTVERTTDGGRTWISTRVSYG